MIDKQSLLEEVIRADEWYDANSPTTPKSARETILKVTVTKDEIEKNDWKVGGPLRVPGLGKGFIMMIGGMMIENEAVLFVKFRLTQVKKAVNKHKKTTSGPQA